MADEANEQIEAQEPVEVPAGEPVQASSAPAAPEVSAAPEAPEVAFSWQASEFVHHHKTMSWYVTAAVVTVLLMGMAVFLRLWLEIGVFLVMGIAVIVYAQKPPRTMMYELSTEGVHIDGRLFPFSEFRSFAVVPDTEWHSIDLEPAKRFNPRMVLLFNTEDFDAIVGHLELHLPRVDRELDAIERVTRLLRF